MTNLTYEETVCADAVLDMQKDIMEAVIENMKVHGDEPPEKALSMLSAAFVMAINDIEKCFGNDHFSLVVIEMLQNKKKRNLQ